MFSDGVPDADPPGVAGGDQLVTNKKERLRWNVQAEDTLREGANLEENSLQPF